MTDWRFRGTTWGLFIVALTLAVACSAGLGQDGTGKEVAASGAAPSTRPAVVLPLSQAPPMPLREYTLDEIAAIFPAFEHEPFETAGYNHFSLPLHYEDRAGDGDANEAFALAHLLSYALDWGDGCYCSRHAYFIFKRCRRFMPHLIKSYDPKLVSYLVKDWQASHGVGGKLIRCKDGYAGLLTIFDREGKIVKEVTYDKPREFFELHGDMAVDAITFLSGRPPTKELAEHLHVRQCKHRQSLIDLGRAALVAERSNAEWKLYDGILKRDRGFAAVRYWEANQKWWQDRKHQAKALKTARSLNAYITLQAFQDFRPAVCPNRSLAAKYDQWARQVEKLLGPDSLIVLHRRLDEAIRKRRISPDLLEKATAKGARCANDYLYLLKLAQAHVASENLPGDINMAASLTLAALRNDYMPGMGNKDMALMRLAWYALCLGYDDVGVCLLIGRAKELIREGGPVPAAWYSTKLGYALFQIGRFDESCRWYEKAVLGTPSGSEPYSRLLLSWASAAAHAGRTDVLRQMLRQRRHALATVNATAVVQAYLDILEGRKINVKDLWVARLELAQRPEQHLFLIQAEYEMLQGLGEGKYKSAEINWYRYDPRNRYMTILCHELFRRNPDDAPGSFYEMLRYQRPSDPWAKQAVAEWKSWGKDANLPDPDRLLRDLQDYPPVKYPKADPARREAAARLIRTYRAGTFACAVHRLVEDRHFIKAEQLALKYRNLLVQADKFFLTIDAECLVHYARNARARARSKALPVAPDKL